MQATSCRGQIIIWAGFPLLCRHAAAFIDKLAAKQPSRPQSRSLMGKSPPNRRTFLVPPIGLKVKEQCCWREWVRMEWMEGSRRGGMQPTVRARSWGFFQSACCGQAAGGSSIMLCELRHALWNENGCAVMPSVSCRRFSISPTPVLLSSHLMSSLERLTGGGRGRMREKKKQRERGRLRLQHRGSREWFIRNSEGGENQESSTARGAAVLESERPREREGERRDGLLPWTHPQPWQSQGWGWQQSVGN